ncbi:DNA polymerase delta subunit 3 [Microplitis mediator]|uniref:DNA polymerase delta subunit 3 n=1 Tax=Microplitis mediator TaxID=375433 RepID=UPI00255546E3|nr:DNA polymerase delta subunit 3 [Microplitis mediator]
MDLMNNYLDTLAGYINDEDKLVTYKWLSKELEVHVNLSKQILEEYWSKNKSSDQLVATIMIIGHTKDGGMRVEVVKESDFGVAADKYDRIISQHLYSLQKSLPDIQLLAEAGQGDTKFSAITCENAVLLSDEELFKRRWGSDKTYMASTAAAAVTAERKPVETKKNIFSNFTKSSDKVSDSKTTNKSNDDNGVSNGAHSSNDVKEDKVEAKKVSPVKSKPAETKKGASKKPVQSQKTGLSNLFGKVAVANSKKSPPNKNKDSADKNNDNKSNGVEESPMEVDESPKIIESNGVSASKSNLKPKDSGSTSNSASDNKSSNEKSSQKSNGDIKAKNKTKQNRGSKRNRSRDSSKEDTKKRKRIFLVSDSSDESAASDPEPDLFDDPPPEEAVVVKEKSPSPPPAKQVEGKRKVRKAVDKTFMDEDGYLVTKKTFVYESASDEEPPTPAAIKEVEVKKATAAQIKKQNKQTSIMSFFKKA